MEVHITDKNFNIVVKEEGKKDIILNGNIEVFNYLTSSQKIFLGALELLNEYNDNYFNNAVSYMSKFARVFNVGYSYGGAKVSIQNDLTNSSLENLPTEKEIIDYANKLRKVASISPVTIYEVNNMNEVPLVCILHFSRYGYAVKRCNNCHQWFIPKTTKDTRYCYRNDEEYTTMRCDVAHKYKNQLKRIENDEAFTLSKRIYNDLRNKYLRAKDVEIQKDAEKKFNDFKIENNKKRKLLKQKKITKKDYIKWLNSMKIK